jgi:hypothetical protein
MATIFGRQALPLTQVLSRRCGDAILGLTGGDHAKVILPSIPPGVDGRMKMLSNILYRGGYTARRPYHAGEELGGRERSEAQRAAA